ncbi:MAG: SpoIIE family protein phosphatase [Spirochaetia bacterium]|nr:SpoIIE family protein phosphatase [Spirochaetia bacterium]
MSLVFFTEYIKKILLIVFSFFFIFGAFTLTCTNNKLKKKPEIKKGFVDLSTWNFIENGNFKLSGEWEFYWNHFITSEMFNKGETPPISGYDKLPNNWNNFEINGKKIGPEGFGSYRLKINIKNKKDNVLCILVKSSNSSFIVYADDNLVLKNGKVGKTEETSAKQRKTTMGCFDLHSEEFLIIIHTSNFNYPKGGIISDFYLGTPTSTSKRHSIKLGLNMFLLGGFFLMFLYHFSIYFSRKKDKSTLYFGIFCGLAFFRQLIFDDMILTQIFPNFYWDVLVRTEYFIIFALLPVVAVFFKSLFYDETPDSVLKLTKISFLLFAPLTLGPVSFLIMLLPIYHVIYIVCGFIGIYVLYKAIKNNRTGSKIVLIGFSIVFITIINDILLVNEIIHSIPLTGFGSLGFIFSQAYLLSKKYANAFEETEELTLSLSEVTDELLEKTIKLKTMHNENIRLTEIKKEIEITSLVQKNIFISNKELNIIHEFDIDVLYLPMNQKAGGDYYNIVHPKENQLSIMIADAIGHGINAALSTMRIDIMSKQASLSSKPHERLNIMNDFICKKKFSSEAWFSAFYCDYKNSKLHYSSAGHPKQALIKTNQNNIKFLKTKGTMIGILENSNYKSEHVTVESGDILILFSDGIYEEYDKKGNEYGEENFQKFLQRNIKKFKKESSFNINKIIINEITNFRGAKLSNDDITLVTVKFQ